MIKELPRGIDFIRHTQAQAREMGLNDLAPNECQQFFLALALFAISAKLYYKDYEGFSSIAEHNLCFRHAGGFHFVNTIGYDTEEDEELQKIKEENPEYYEAIKEIQEERDYFQSDFEDEEIAANDEMVLSYEETVRKHLKTNCFFQHYKPNSDSECVIFEWQSISYDKKDDWGFVKNEAGIN